MEKQLLDTQGDLTPRPAVMNSTLVIEGSTAPDQLDSADLSTPSVTIHFASTADGRGFSLAQHLRRRLHFTGEIIASGAVIPDQVAQLFANGFDGVELDAAQIDRYGQNHWQNASKPIVSSLYWRSSSIQDKDIWDFRVAAG